MAKSYLLEDLVNNLEDLIVIKQAILDRIVPQDAEGVSAYIKADTMFLQELKSLVKGVKEAMNEE